MKTPILKSIDRSKLGKNFCRKSRRKGYIPAVVYGTPNTYINLNGSQTLEILRKHGENAVVELNTGGDTFTAMIKEVQKHPVSGIIYHVDFMPVDLNDNITTKIPIGYINTRSIKNKGGIIQSQKDSVEVEGKVKDIPKNITVDVSKFDVNQTLKVKDIEIAAELTISENIENVVASLTGVRNTDNMEDEEDII